MDISWQRQKLICELTQEDEDKVLEVAGTTGNAGAIVEFDPYLNQDMEAVK